MGVVNNQDYYNFFNLGSYLNQCKIKGNLHNFRYLKDYVNTNISMFSYEGLPGKLTSRIVETALCFNNNLCLYKNAVYEDGILCKYLPLGEFDEYWYPTRVQLMTLSGKIIVNSVPYEDIVILRDNTMDIIPFVVIMEYLDKINQIETTLIKNIKQARIPVFFTGDKESVASFNKIIEKAEKEDVFALVDKSISNAFAQYDIKFPIESESLMELMKNYMNFLNGSMGIYGGSSQKRERLLVGEISSQNDFIDNIYQDRKNNRINAIEEANKKFGWNIKVVESFKQYTQDRIDLSENYQVAMAQIDNTNESGGNNNEK